MPKTLHIRYYSILIKFKLPTEETKRKMCGDLWHQPRTALTFHAYESKPMEYGVLDMHMYEIEQV